MPVTGERRSTPAPPNPIFAPKLPVFASLTIKSKSA